MLSHSKYGADPGQCWRYVGVVSLVSQQVESIIQIHQCENFEMAWLEHDRSGNFHLCFRLGERKFKKSLKTKDERSAGAACTRVEENIRLLEMGRLSIPVGANVAAFLLSDGKLTNKPEASNSVSLGKLFSEYRDSLPADSLEPETLRVARIHTDHIERALGQRFMIDRLRLDTLQEYVVKRSKASGKNGKSLSATTIRKELSTFRTIWTWAISKGYVSCPFPNQNLRFPKTTREPASTDSARTWRHVLRSRWQLILPPRCRVDWDSTVRRPVRYSMLETLHPVREVRCHFVSYF